MPLFKCTVPGCGYVARSRRPRADCLDKSRCTWEVVGETSAVDDGPPAPVADPHPTHSDADSAADVGGELDRLLAEEFAHRPEDDRRDAPAATHDPSLPGPRSDPPPHVWEVGARILGGQFKLIEALRGGAQARAFVGESTIDGTSVFVKIQLNPSGRPDTFAKQIDLRPKLLSIDHPNLLSPIALDLDHGDLCEVYEFVRGETLEALFGRGPLERGLVSQLVVNVADGLAELHRKTLIHRDLKPENVMYVQRGAGRQFCIVDYGTVTNMDGGGLTRVAGTVQYSPPERMQRFIENSELSKAWDWWSLGSILQEAIDGRHPYQRLRELFPEAATVGGGRGIEHLFDEIQREGAVERFRMHAGMVEITARNPAAEPWLPLLRGLLTFNRSKRWGRAEIATFLDGKVVPKDFYTEQRGREEDVHYDDDKGVTWRSIAAYARGLADQAAQEDDTRGNAWQKAQRLLVKGEFARHVKSVLHDIDLAEKLDQCLWINGREGPRWPLDFSTALALYALGEGEIEEPAVAGHVLDAGYVRHLAALAQAHLDDELEKLITTLLDRSFRELLRRVAPESTRGAIDRTVAGLVALKTDIENLVERAKQLKVESPETYLKDRPSLLVALASSEPAGDVKVIVNEYHKRLGGTTNRALDTIYAEPDSPRHSALDVKAVRLSLLLPERNGYQTHESTASRYGAAATQLRLAEAYVRASRRMFHRPWWEAFVLCTLVSLGLTIVGGALWTWMLGDVAINGAFAQFGDLAFKEKALLFLVALVPAALAALLYRALAPMAIRDIDALGGPTVGDAGNSRLAALEASRTFLSGISDLQQGSIRANLRRINAKIEPLSKYLSVREYQRKVVWLPRSSLVLLALVTVLSVPFLLEALWRDGSSSFPRAFAFGWARLPDAPAPKALYRFDAVLAQTLLLPDQAVECVLPANTAVRSNVPIDRLLLASIRVPANVCPKATIHQISAWVLPGKNPNSEAVGAEASAKAAQHDAEKGSRSSAGRTVNGNTSKAASREVDQAAAPRRNERTNGILVQDYVAKTFEGECTVPTGTRVLMISEPNPVGANIADMVRFPVIPLGCEGKITLRGSYMTMPGVVRRTGPNIPGSVY